MKDLGVFNLPLNQIHRNPYQPRVNFDENKLRELAENIRINGLLQPIVVRKIEENKYIIIAGERRYRAHQILKRYTIKARVIECDDRTAYELTLLENIQREDLSLLEEARGYKYLKEQFNYKLEDLSKVTGKSVSNISNIMSILDEPEEIQEYVNKGVLTLAAYVWIKKLPNKQEKLNLLRKLEKEEIKRTNIRYYVNRICNAYEIAEKLGISVEDVLKRKGKAGRFDIKTHIIPEDLRFYFIGDYGFDAKDIEYLPSKRLLYSAFTIMHDKSIAKQFSNVLLNRDKLDGLFLDCGAFTCMKHKQWSFFSKIDELIAFYENIKPEICTSLDIPTFPFLFEHWKITPQEAIDMTIKNAIKFRDWKPSFKTTKVFVLQGNNKEEYLECLRRYIDLKIFEQNNIALAFGGIATTSLKNQVEWISYVTKSKEFQEIKDKLQFVHGFGVGNPERIATLYQLGVNSFDAVTTIIITNTGGYWLRNGKVARHIIHESPLTRKVRFYFNAVSFWGQLTERFAKLKGIDINEEQEKISLKEVEDVSNTETYRDTTEEG